MRVPIRKAGQYTYIKSDPLMTEAKLSELKKKLKKLKELVQPEMVKEVKRLALMGDFSENAAYQIAKGRLRGANEKIDKITQQIAEAKIISPDKDIDKVKIGHLVTIESNKQIKKYRLLGSAETNPSQGAISYQSPLGSALLDKQVGEIIEIIINGQAVEYKIIAIKY